MTRARVVTIALLFVVALAAPLGIWLAQRSLIYFPSRWVAPRESLLPGWEEVSYATLDGLRLSAWFSPPDPGAAVVLVFNGNAGNRSGRAALGAALADRGFGVLLTDYRGYGGNPGRPTEEGLALDARAAAGFLATEVLDHRVVYYGESLGAAVAVELATERAPAGLILRSPFTSLADVAGIHYPFLPAGLLLRDRYPSIERIADVGAPVLILAGTGDSIVPPEQSEAIYRAASEPKRLVLIEGADHNDFELLAGAELIEAVVEFIALLR